MPTALPAHTDPAGAIRRLAGFVAGHPVGAHPDAALARARLAFLDTLGCAIQGATTDTARRTREALAAWGPGPAPVIGGGAVGMAPPWAALANGTAAHARDLDDYTLTANDHPSAVLVPAVLAAAAGRRCSLGDALDAYLVGLEVIFRIGRAVNMGHYNLGWHTTSTIDGLGATVAVARLSGLDAERTACALALAVSMGAGMNSQFGTSAKPLHAGLSAKTGVVAATLAGAGLTANPDVLDGPVSFASLMVPPGAADFERALEGLGESWGIETDGLGAKVYPSCGYTHRSVDAAIALHAALPPADRARIAAVRVSIPDFHLAILPYATPRTPDEALFSTAWCVATALLKGRNRLEDFEADALADPAVRALCDRVTVTGRRPRRPEINVDPDEPDTVEVTLTDDRVLGRACPRWTGMPGADLGPAQFLDKFHACLAAAGPGRSEAFATLPARLLDDGPDTPIAPLLANLAGTPPAVAAQ
jgi:2-methylcitrate dehydratase PrpD